MSYYIGLFMFISIFVAMFLLAWRGVGLKGALMAFGTAAFLGCWILASGILMGLK